MCEEGSRQTGSWCCKGEYDMHAVILCMHVWLDPQTDEHPSICVSCVTSDNMLVELWVRSLCVHACVYARTT